MHQRVHQLELSILNGLQLMQEQVERLFDYLETFGFEVGLLYEACEALNDESDVRIIPEHTTRLRSGH